MCVCALCIVCVISYKLLCIVCVAVGVKEQEVIVQKKASNHQDCANQTSFSAHDGAHHHINTRSWMKFKGNVYFLYTKISYKLLCVVCVLFVHCMRGWLFSIHDINTRSQIENAGMKF